MRWQTSIVKTQSNVVPVWAYAIVRTNGIHTIWYSSTILPICCTFIKICTKKNLNTRIENSNLKDTYHMCYLETTWGYISIRTDTIILSLLHAPKLPDRYSHLPNIYQDLRRMTTPCHRDALHHSVSSCDRAVYSAFKTISDIPVQLRRDYSHKDSDSSSDPTVFTQEARPIQSSTFAARILKSVLD